jgi:predicted membrane chloride channel (bestrophin family)
MLGFNQGRKIAYLPFPFIYAQGTEFLMAFSVLLIPLLMDTFVQSSFLGAFLSYFTCVCFFVLYEACRELEDPFLYEPNELPLLKWQSQFNEMLLSVVQMRQQEGISVSSIKTETDEY